MTDIRVIGCELVAPGIDGDVADATVAQDYAACTQDISPAQVAHLDAAYGDGNGVLLAEELDAIDAPDANQIAEACVFGPRCTLLAFAFVTEESPVSINVSAGLVTAQNSGASFTCDADSDGDFVSTLGDDDDCDDGYAGGAAGNGDGVVVFHIGSGTGVAGSAAAASIAQGGIGEAAAISIVGAPAAVAVSLAESRIQTSASFSEALSCEETLAPGASAAPLNATLATVQFTDAGGRALARLTATLASSAPHATIGQVAPQSGVVPGTGEIAQLAAICGATTYGTTNVTATVASIATTSAPAPLEVCFAADDDCDGALNSADNCPSLANVGQVNTDAASLPIAGLPSDNTVPMSDAAGDACDADDDNDGLTDAIEAGAGCALPGGGMSGALDPLLRDTDGDRSIDGAECALGFNPNDALSKPPGIVPGEQDNDGLSDAFEAAIGTTPNDSDSDDDGMNDGIEFKFYGTSPLVLDSDADGCDDDAEIASLNADRIVSALDLVLVATNFTRMDRLHLDVNKDGVIGALDLVLVATNFRTVPC